MSFKTNLLSAALLAGFSVASLNAMAAPLQK